jgi:hypothetical protein
MQRYDDVGAVLFVHELPPTQQQLREPLAWPAAFGVNVQT